MSWWGWVVVGAILLGAELALVNAEFYFVCIGSAAIITGLVTALAPGIAPWMEWAIFAGLVILSLVAFRQRVHDLVKGYPLGVDAGPAPGGELVMPVGLAPGETCQAEHAGSFWTVRNDGPVLLEAGAKARIQCVDGLTLVLRSTAYRAAPDLMRKDSPRT